MTDNDAMQMIQRCIEEIQMLRNQVSALQPRADAYAAIAQILVRRASAEPDCPISAVGSVADETPDV